MVEDWVSTTMYATKRRRRTVKSIKTPAKDPPKSNPSKRHRERLNGELDHLASLLPFEQSVLSKLDKLSILRLAVSYLRTKSYFQAVLPDRYHLDSHHILSRSHLYHDPGFSEGDSILQALYGFLIVVTCDGEVFYASRTVEQYLGFHQSDIIHQSVMELIHSEDREEFKKQLSWNSMLPQDKSNYTLHEVMMPENYHYLHRSFTVRFRCLLDNTSGFITLEISGWLRILHGQNNRAEDPQLALFATCCPFGPLSLLDLPSRELTFKSKHKMDFSPISMDNRGKMMFGYSDRDLLIKSGYDLVHPDDLNYFSLGHQELIKTGSSGLIAYRWLTKDLQWIWLQSSCKVIYKNSKPDFVICTHRQLTDDEGQDLFHKRGSEFKLPYPLLDLDICSGFDFPADESSTKLKGTRGKKQKNQMKDFSTKRKKSGCREPINGLNGYGPYQALNGYENGELKPEFLYHYPSQNFGIEPDLLYNRSHGYTSFPGSMYPTPESYRLDMEKHGYSNGYYIDPHRQYQHPVPYPSNSYADLVTPGTKFGYDVAKYGFDTYSLDLAKKVHYSEELSRYENDYRKYGYEYGADRLAPRINGTLEPVDLRSTSMYNGATIANGMESGIPPPPCVPPSPSILRSDLCHGQTFHSRESKVIRSPSNGMQNDGMNSISVPSNSVIKNTTTPRSVHTNNRSTSAESPNTNTYQNQMRGNVIHNSSTLWAQCAKSRQAMNNPSPISTPHSDHSGSSPKHKRSVSTVDLTSDQMNGRVGMVSDKPDSNGQINSPVSGVTATSVIHTPISEKHLHNRTCEKQPVVGGIPVPVVKSPWIQQFPTSQYGEYKDWSMSTNDMYAYHQRQPRGIITDSLSQAHKVSIP